MSENTKETRNTPRTTIGIEYMQPGKEYFILSVDPQGNRVTDLRESKTGNIVLIPKTARVHTRSFTTGNALYPIKHIDGKWFLTRTKKEIAYEIVLY